MVGRRCHMLQGQAGIQDVEKRSLRCQVLDTGPTYDLVR
jgi:hypothetical protein